MLASSHTVIERILQQLSFRCKKNQQGRSCFDLCRFSQLTTQASSSFPQAKTSTEMIEHAYSICLRIFLSCHLLPFRILSPIFLARFGESRAVEMERKICKASCQSFWRATKVIPETGRAASGAATINQTLCRLCPLCPLCPKAMV